MNDEQLPKIATEIDDLLAEMMEKHQIPPLILGTVFLARLVVMAEFTDVADDFNRVLQVAIDKIISNKERVKH
jgi:hypothetical protein